MNKLQSLVLVITLLVGSMSVATAQDYDKGVAAAQSGDTCDTDYNLNVRYKRGG